MALSNQYNNVDDKLVNQSIVKMLLHSTEGERTKLPTGSSVKANVKNEQNHKSE